uniref:Uncharacterized protein n=1 Tax=Prolemur simus TaxID=1328070 RepID=A0A8C8ZBR1_PROSS
HGPSMPGARSPVRAGPAPQSSTSAVPTLSLSRGGRPRSQVRGGAAYLPGCGPTPGAPGRARRSLALRGRRGVTQGARRASGRGRRHLAPTLRGAPGEA